MAPEAVAERWAGRRHRRRFNEAGARWPRKPLPEYTLMLVIARFNEAGARWPRKHRKILNGTGTVDALQ